MANTTVLNNRVLYVLGIVFLCLIVGQSIVVVPTSIPFMAVLCAILFFIGFVNVNLAAVLLIGAMLLSPEINVAQIPGRDVVLRIEDLLIVVFGVAWIVRMGLVKRVDFLVHTVLNKNILFFVVVFILVTLRGMMLDFVEPAKGFFYILKYFEYFVIYYFASDIIKTKEQVRLFLKAFLFTYVVVCIYAMSQIGLTRRVSAPFEGTGEPNTLGGYLVLLQAIILGVMVHGESSRQRIIMGGLFFLSLVPFALTLSRASYLSFVPMYFTIVLFNGTKKRNFLIGAMIVTIVLSIFFFPKSIKERVAYTFQPAETYDAPIQKVFGVEVGPSTSARIYNWKIMIDRWKAKPFMGYGVTGQGFIDGQYIRTLVEMGALGLTAFLLLLYVLLRNTMRIYYTSKDPLYRGIALGFLAGHIGMMFHAIGTNTFIIIRIMEPYWFLAAMVMAIPNLEKTKALEVQEVQQPEKKVFRNTDRLLTRKSGL